MAAQPSQAYKDQLAGLDSAVMNAFRAVHNLKVCLGQPSMPLLDRVSEDVTRSEVEMQLHYMNILNFVRPMTNLEQHKVHVEALLQYVYLCISPMLQYIDKIFQHCCISVCIAFVTPAAGLSAPFGNVFAPCPLFLPPDSQTWT